MYITLNEMQLTVNDRAWTLSKSELKAASMMDVSNAGEAGLSCGSGGRWAHVQLAIWAGQMKLRNAEPHPTITWSNTLEPKR